MLSHISPLPLTLMNIAGFQIAFLENPFLIRKDNQYDRYVLIEYTNFMAIFIFNQNLKIILRHEVQLVGSEVIVLHKYTRRFLYFLLVLNNNYFNN